MMIGHDMPRLMMHEDEPITVEAYGAFDMDRTLLDTNKVIELLYALLTQHGLSNEQAREEIDGFYEKTGQSVELIGQLRERYAGLIDVVMDQALALAQDGLLPDLVYDGAVAIFDELEAAEEQFGVFTYGNTEDQTFKLSLLRAICSQDKASLPGMITNVKHKAELISASWFDVQTGYFVIPDEFEHSTPVRAKRVVVVDDKDQNLKSSNQNILGVHINNEDPNKSLSALAAALQAGRSLTDISSHYENFDS